MSTIINSCVPITQVQKFSTHCLSYFIYRSPPVPPAPTSGYFIWKYLFVKYCFVHESHYFQSLFQISSNSEPVLATSSENLGGAGLGMQDCPHIDQLAKRFFLRKGKKRLIFSVYKKTKNQKTCFFCSQWAVIFYQTLCENPRSCCVT